MVLKYLDTIAMENTQSHGSSGSPLFGLVDLSLFCIFSVIENFFLKFWPSSSGYSKIGTNKIFPESESIHQESVPHENRDDVRISRDEVKSVMEKLGFFCRPESEKIQEFYSSSELSGLFEDQEPSLEEVKQAFDVFDQNKDGFIDEMELQRVLCILGLKEANELENCQKMIRNFDQNGDGRIDFHEFVKIMENNFC